jgi:hypothetical protein
VCQPANHRHRNDPTPCLSAGGAQSAAMPRAKRRHPASTRPASRGLRNADARRFRPGPALASQPGDSPIAPHDVAARRSRHGARLRSDSVGLADPRPDLVWYYSTAPLLCLRCAGRADADCSARTESRSIRGHLSSYKGCLNASQGWPENRPNFGTVARQRVGGQPPLRGNQAIRVDGAPDESRRRRTVRPAF